MNRETNHVGRQQIRGELDPLEAAIQSPSQGLREGGLANAGNVLNQ